MSKVAELTETMKAALRKLYSDEVPFMGASTVRALERRGLITTNTAPWTPGQGVRSLYMLTDAGREVAAQEATEDEAAATEVIWRASRDNLIAHLPNGSKVTAFFLADPDGIWGEGYGYIASIPGTKRAVHGEGRLESLDAVAGDALKRVEKALQRKSRAA